MKFTIAGALGSIAYSVFLIINCDGKVVLTVFGLNCFAVVAVVLIAHFTTIVIFSFMFTPPLLASSYDFITLAEHDYYIFVYR